MAFEEHISHIIYGWSAIDKVKSDLFLVLGKNMAQYGLGIVYTLITFQNLSHVKLAND